MILENVFYYLGGIFLNLLLVIGLIGSIWWLLETIWFKKYRLRIVYIALFLMNKNKRGIGKVFKCSDGKKYLIKVEEVEE